MAQAREKAWKNRQAVANGENPLADKSVPTFAEAMYRFFKEVKKPTLKDCRSTEQWLQVAEKYALPVFGDTPVNKITRQDVLRLLMPVWTTKPETGRRLRERVRMVLQWAVSFGFVEHNVAGEVLDGALPSMPNATTHLRALPYMEVPAAYTSLQAYPFVEAASLCMQFLILTAVRQSEARGAKWEEIDFDAKVWTIPNDRMKMGKGHRVPLSDEALAVLEHAKTLSLSNELVFPSRQTGGVMSNATLNKLLGILGLADATVPHGFRSSFRTWAAEYADADFVIAELALAHKVGSSVERIYARTDLLEKRRRLMQLWADYVTGKHSQAEVVALPVRA